MFNKIKNKLQEMKFAQNYTMMLPYIRPYWKRAILAVVITIPVGAMDAVIAWILKPYMDVVMIEKSTSASMFLPFLIILFSLTQSLFSYLSTYLNTWVGTKITMDLKGRLFKKMLRNEASFFDTWNSGDIQFRFNSDVDLACAGLLNNLKMFFTRFFSSISLVCVLFINSWELAIVATVILIIALFPLSLIRKKIDSLVTAQTFSAGDLYTHYNEAHAGNRVIASYNLYKILQTKFQSTLRTLFKLGMKLVQKTALISPVMHFIISFGIAGVIWYGSHLIITDKLTPGGFVSFITALLMLYTPIKSMGKIFTSVQLSFMAMERISALINRKNVIQDKKDAKKLETIAKNIEYRGVSFEYIANKPVLKNINLDIKAGETYAFVGGSGGGKTTLANLLPRFYEIYNGSILVDGNDIKDVTVDSLRDNIAVVFQDNFLFAGTIRDNILLGRVDVSQEEIENAIENACLKDFIASLSDGLDTEIGERGVLVSGGQRQRIAIARAFIKNAPVVILDEATSSLDNKSEKVVQQAINNLMKDRTVLIIAHRLSTVKNADKIVVVNEGEIKEMGTHEELIANPESLYSTLYKTQL